MSLLDHPDAKALLADAVVTPEAITGQADRLTVFLQRYLPKFYRSEQRATAALVIRGRVLRRNEEARIYHWHKTTGGFPPRRLRPNLCSGGGKTSMAKREQLLLNNALDALDRLYDGESTVIDIQALLQATAEALRDTAHFPHLENPAAELLAVTRSKDSRGTKRDRALGITDELRHYLTRLTTRPLSAA